MDKLLQELENSVREAEKNRDNRLREVRKSCLHLRLMEDEMQSPPMRICLDCGAEERGWYCGYQVLTLRDEYNGGPKVERAIVTTKGKWTDYRICGKRYEVGQSHSCFSGGGFRTYDQLTEPESV